MVYALDHEVLIIAEEDILSTCFSKQAHQTDISVLVRHLSVTCSALSKEIKPARDFAFYRKKRIREFNRNISTAYLTCYIDCSPRPAFLAHPTSVQVCVLAGRRGVMSFIIPAADVE